MVVYGGNSHQLVQYYPSTSSIYECKRCRYHIATVNQLTSIIFKVSVDLHATLPRYTWTWEQDGLFRDLVYVYLVDIPNDDLDVVAVYCQGCAAHLGYKMVREPGHCLIKMEKLQLREGDYTSSALVWLPPQNYRRN